MSHSCFISNNRDEDVKMVLYEQLPKATDEKIKVKLLEPSEDEVTITEQNLVKFDLKLKARTSEKIVFAYEIEYPDQKFIQVKKEFLSTNL